ncbi:MAG: hypothetical protein ACI4DV_01390 [Lachnospiraceae bacterium]
MNNEVIDFLRDRSEEEDLSSVLKTNMGGYTKKSVQEYIGQLRKQQQAAGKRFNDDLQAMISEKEKVQEELRQVKAKLSEKEAQYRILSESLKEYKKADGGYSTEDYVNLQELLKNEQSKASVLENEKRQIMQKQEQTQQLLSEKEAQLEQSIQEHHLTEEFLFEEKEKVKEALAQVQELTSQMVLAQSELKFLREMTSEGKVGNLKMKIAEQQEKIGMQEKLLEQRREQLSAKEEQLRIRENQIQMLEEKAEKLHQSVEAVTVQNQKMEAYQKELGERLQSVFAENLELLNQKSELAYENITLTRKLDAAACECSLEKIRKVTEQPKGGNQ